MTRATSDRSWGRMPGARPPLRPWIPLAWWVATAIALAVLVALVVRGPGPLDDPDPSDQRTGLLVSAPSATRVSRLALPGDPIGRRAVLVVFDRRVPSLRQFARVTDELPRGVAVVLVVPGATASAAAALPRRARLLGDPGGSVARAVRIHRPLDRGRPVGYAVIDRRARVRYVTLDPRYLDHGFEIHLITRAAR